MSSLIFFEKKNTKNKNVTHTMHTCTHRANHKYQFISVRCLTIMMSILNLAFLQNINNKKIYGVDWSESLLGTHVIGYIFSSPELCSGWAIVITFRPSSVCPSVRPSFRPSVNIFKRLLLWSHWANFAQISYGASLGWGNKRLLKWSHSVN